MNSDDGRVRRIHALLVDLMLDMVDGEEIEFIGLPAGAISAASCPLPRPPKKRPTSERSRAARLGWNRRQRRVRDEEQVHEQAALVRLGPRPSRSCRCCGDPVLYVAAGLCAECGAEILRGEIPNVVGALEFGFGLPGPREEIGPWQENAIRALEGD